MGSIGQQRTKKTKRDMEMMRGKRSGYNHNRTFMKLIDPEEKGNCLWPMLWTKVKGNDDYYNDIDDHLESSQWSQWQFMMYITCICLFNILGN